MHGTVTVMLVCRSVPSGIQFAGDGKYPSLGIKILYWLIWLVESAFPPSSFFLNKIATVVQTAYGFPGSQTEQECWTTTDIHIVLKAVLCILTVLPPFLPAVCLGVIGVALLRVSIFLISV